MQNITLYVEDSEERYPIGAVIPPAGSSDNSFLHEILGDLWIEWRETMPHPDSDGEFIDWPIERGWREAESNSEHTFRV